MINVFVDVDGVLLDWDKGYKRWFQKHNAADAPFEIALPDYNWEDIQKFHKHPDYAKLNTIRGADVHFAELRNHTPYKYRLLSNSNDNFIQLRHRLNNLFDWFGPTVLIDAEFLPAGSDKGEFIKQRFPNDVNILIDDHAKKVVGAVSNPNVYGIVFGNQGEIFEQREKVRYSPDWKHLKELMFSNPFNLVEG